METKLSRDRDGKLQAETRIPLGFENRELRIETSKHYSGGTATTAKVVEVTESGFRFAIGIGGSGKGDYSKTIAHERCRATEKAIERLHHKALAQQYAIEAEARAHYGQTVASAVQA